MKKIILPLLLMVCCFLIPLSLHINERSYPVAQIELHIAHAGIFSDIADAIGSAVSGIGNAISGAFGGGSPSSGSGSGVSNNTAAFRWAREGACSSCTTNYAGPDVGAVGTPTGVQYNDNNSNGYMDAGDSVMGPSGGSGGSGSVGGGGAPPVVVRPPTVSTFPPIANIMVRNSGGAWTGQNITIYAGEDIDLRWNSTRTTVCSGVNFTATGISGIQTTVIAPTAGNSKTYTIDCVQGTLHATDSLTVTARSTPAPQCDDNINNDAPEDTLVDFDGGGTALPASYDFCTQHPDSSYIPLCPHWNWRHGYGENIKKTVESIDVPLPGQQFYYDQPTANKLCEIAGYGSATLVEAQRFGSRDGAPFGQWTGSAWISNGGGPNVFISRLACTAPLAPPGPPDPGCTSPTDTDETDGPPTVSLRVKNDNTTMSYTGNNLTIPAGNNISLRWNSSNATQCVGTAFSISPATLTSGTQSTVTEPTQGNTTRYSVRCTGPKGSATDFLDVTAVAVTGQPPTITADPRIVRYGEDTTLTWNTGTSDPAECSLSGSGATLHTLPNQTDSSTFPVIAETIFSIACPGGTGSVTVKVLPQVQES